MDSGFHAMARVQTGVQTLVGELRPHDPCSTAKKKFFLNTCLLELKLLFNVFKKFFWVLYTEHTSPLSLKKKVF